MLFVIIALITFVMVITWPFFLYNIFVSWRKKEIKRSRKLAKILIALILIPGFFWRVLPGSNLIWMPFDKYQEWQYNECLTGLKFGDGELIYGYDSPRAFNGDGYSIEVVQMDESVKDYFKSPKESFFKNYPKPGIRAHWKVKRWSRTPFKKDERMFYEFAKTKLPSSGFQLSDLLREKGNYYSYRYFMHSGDVVGNIDFYIIAPKRGVMVYINHNT